MRIFALLAAISFVPAHSQTKEPKKPVLTCPEVRTRVGLILDIHYMYKNFDDELSQRTLKKLFETIDGGKSYFLKSDIDTFKNLDTKIDDLIAQSDCDFIQKIGAIFMARVDERTAFAIEQLGKPMTFKVDESLKVGKQEFAADLAESNERWRKRLKLQVLNMKDVDGEAKARERLKKRYLQVAKAIKERGDDDIYNDFLNAFSLSLDPHSTHFLPQEQEDFNIRLGNSLEGIGATLQEVDGYITVQSLIPGGAAARDARLQIGDKIIGVDPGDGSGMNDVVDMELGKAVRFIRGKKGTRVKLLLIQKTDTGTKRITIEIVRAAVQLTSASAKGDVLVIEKKRIGVVRLPAFYTDFSCRGRNTAECHGASNDTANVIKSLMAQKIDALILDLRNNGGGDLPESIRLTGLFIPEGTVVQTVDRKRMTRTMQDQNPSTLYEGPFAVLINKNSASASEIVAGAIQDYGRGLILGDARTYGKATVQVIHDIPNAAGTASTGAIKVTQSKFYRPSGKSNQALGVESDITIPSVFDTLDAGEKDNDYFLKWDSIKPASDYKTLQNFAPMLADLKAKSAKRIAASKEFAEFKIKMDKLKLERDKATISLKEEVVPKPKETAKQKSKKGKKTDVVDESLVIQPDDIQLQEAARIVVDSMASASVGGLK